MQNTRLEDMGCDSFLKVRISCNTGHIEGRMGSKPGFRRGGYLQIRILFMLKKILILSMLVCGEVGDKVFKLKEYNPYRVDGSNVGLGPK